MSKRFDGALLAAALCVATGAHAAPSSLVVFGDSFSDTGNAYLQLGGTIAFPPYPTGSVTLPPFPLIPDAPYPRGALIPALSNGPNWTEFVGTRLGLPVMPSTLGGTNFAFGGANSGPLPLVPSPVIPSLVTQFNGPAAPPTSPFFGGGPIDPNTLYAVWGGSNDIRRALEVYSSTLVGTGNTGAALAAASAVIAAGVGNVASVVNAIAAGGGQQILSLNVPDVGLAPAIDLAPPGTGTLATTLSSAFNTGLAVAIDAIELAHGIDVIEVDTFKLLQAVVASPAAFGLSNATDTCLQIGGSGACGNPDAYLFLDGIHPTAAGHRIIGEAVIAAVPSPYAGSLMIAGLMVLALRGSFVRLKRV